MLKPFVRVTLALSVLLVVPGSAQEQVDQEVTWEIRREAANSQLGQTLHHLTDVYGPRLTGSPNLEQAADWAVKTMEGWGLTGGRLEPWDFGHPGWLNERLAVHVVAPVHDSLVAEVLAWTPGTDGPVRGSAVPIVLPERPTEADLNAFLEGVRAQVARRIVLVDAPQQVPVTFNPAPRRYEERDLREEFGADRPPAREPRARPSVDRHPSAPSGPRPLSPRAVNERLNVFLVKQQALARIDDAGRGHGQIRAFANRTYDVAKAPPTLVMRNEDYGRLWRLLDAGRDVELEIDIVNQVYPEGRTMYNAIAEVPGSDKADEIVMLGAHLDSWHVATGATDNAIGCAVVMEAARIVAALGVRPRRTIRVVLWSGEEQGLLGSQAYVREHFGTAESPKAGFGKLAGYVNIDSGTGRVRGATVFGPPEGAAVLRDVLAPFEDLGVVGAGNTTSRRSGRSDHRSFNEAGLPGIVMTLDPIEYRTSTWHTNLDTYERVVLEDAKASATVIAAMVYHLAVRDELLPRFGADSMPPPPRSSQTGAGQR